MQTKHCTWLKQEIQIEILVALLLTIEVSFSKTSEILFLPLDNSDSYQLLKVICSLFF